MKKVICLSVILLFSVTAQAKSKPQKHALAQVATVATAPVTKPAGFFKKTFGVILFGVEIPVDGVHLAFYGADKAFDALSLEGKYPPLDTIYAGVHVADIDTGKLDKFLENTEQRMFGHHN